MRIDHPISYLGRDSADPLSASLRPFVDLRVYGGLFCPTNKFETKYSLRGKKKELIKIQIYATLIRGVH